MYLHSVITLRPKPPAHRRPIKHRRKEPVLRILAFWFALALLVLVVLIADTAVNDYEARTRPLPKITPVACRVTIPACWHHHHRRHHHQ